MGTSNIRPIVAWLISRDRPYYKETFVRGPRDIARKAFAEHYQNSKIKEPARDTSRAALLQG